MYLVKAIILVAVCTTIGNSENKWKRKGLSNLYKKPPYSGMSVTTFSL